MARLYPDTPEGRARRRKEEIETEMAALEQELGDIDTFLEMLAKFGGAQGSGPVPLQGPSNPSMPPAPISPPAYDPVAGGMTQAQFEQRIKEVLAEAIRPVSVSEIVTEFRRRNHPIGGVHETKNASTKLWRANGVVVNFRGVGYWLRSRDLPSYGYKANQQTEPAET